MSRWGCGKFEEFVLYENSTIKIAGNTNGSHGYLYLLAWLK